jgi:hypothetical protein
MGRLFHCLHSDLITFLSPLAIRAHEMPPPHVGAAIAFASLCHPPLLATAHAQLSPSTFSPFMVFTLCLSYYFFGVFILLFFDVFITAALLTNFF